MSDYELYPEISIIVTGYEYQPAEPSNGVMSGYMEEVFYEARDQNDKIINNDGFLDLIWDLYKKELTHLAEKMMSDKHESYEAAKCDYYEGLDEDRKLTA